MNLFSKFNMMMSNQETALCFLEGGRRRAVFSPPLSFSCFDLIWMRVSEGFSRRSYVIQSLASLFGPASRATSCSL